MATSTADPNIDQLVAWYTAADDDQRRTWVGQLTSEAHIAVARQVITAYEQGTADWRQNPTTMAHHLTGGTLRQWRYSMMLGEKFKDAVEGRSIRQIWCLPPRYGKSVIASQWGPTWALDRNPAYKMILVSYGDTLAVSNATVARDNLREHRDQLRAQLRADRRSAGLFATTAGGQVLARGINSGIIGMGAHGIVFDDPFKNWIEAHSAARRQSVDDAFRSVVSSRLDFADSWVIVVMTRWHEDDLVGRLMQRGAAGTGEQWELVRMAEVADEYDPGSLDQYKRMVDPLGRAAGELLEPERFDRATIAAKHLAAGCTPAETPILMADWTVKPISEVRRGDQVVGWVSESGHKMRMQPTTVEETTVRPGTVHDYRMASGRVVRATIDHRWFKRAGREYGPAHVGSPLRFVCPVERPTLTERERALWNWLAGMVDGEGHIGSFRRLNICQTLGKNGPIVDQLDSVLTELGLSYRRTVVPRRQERWADKVDFDIQAVGPVYRTLIRETLLAKKAQAVRALYDGAGRTGRYVDRVESISNPVDEPVYALQTGTGNYVAWGYASSNSYLTAGMYQQRPAPEEGGEIRRAWFVDALVETLPDRYDDVVSSWDMKLKDKESGDYVVGQMWGRTGKDFWLIDQLRGQWNQATTENAIALMTVRHPEIRRHYIENTGNGPEVMTSLRATKPGYEVSDDVAGALGMVGDEQARVSALRQRGLGQLLPVVVKGDKSVRMRVHSGKAEAGDVHLRTGWAGLGPFLDEVSAFPDGAHDDQVDAMSQALSKLAGGEASAKAPSGTLPKAQINTRTGTGGTMQTAQPRRRRTRSAQIMVPRTTGTGR